MTHCQIFYPFDNEDGYISVVCHRERFLENLLSLGWQKTAAEAIAVRDELTKSGQIPEHQNFMFPEATQVVQALAKKAREEGSVNFDGDKSRKKLSLKK